MEDSQIISLLPSIVITLIITLITFWLRRFFSEIDSFLKDQKGINQNILLKMNSHESDISALKENTKNLDILIDKEVSERNRRIDKHSFLILELEKKVAVIESKNK